MVKTLYFLLSVETSTAIQSIYLFKVINTTKFGN